MKYGNLSRLTIMKSKKEDGKIYTVLFALLRKHNF